MINDVSWLVTQKYMDAYISMIALLMHIYVSIVIRMMRERGWKKSRKQPKTNESEMGKKNIVTKQ